MSWRILVCFFILLTMSDLWIYLWGDLVVLFNLKLIYLSLFFYLKQLITHEVIYLSIAVESLSCCEVRKVLCQIDLSVGKKIIYKILYKAQYISWSQSAEQSLLKQNKITIYLKIHTIYTAVERQYTIKHQDENGNEKAKRAKGNTQGMQCN